MDESNRFRKQSPWMPTEPRPPGWGSAQPNQAITFGVWLPLVEKRESKPESQLVSSNNDAYRKFRLKLFDADGNLLKGEKFSLQLENETIIDSTDFDGVLQATIPATTYRAKLTLTRIGEVYNLKLGFLDDAQTTTGAQMRLHNLGYKCGESVNDALIAFRDDADLCADTPTEKVQKQLGERNPWQTPTT